MVAANLNVDHTMSYAMPQPWVVVRPETGALGEQFQEYGLGDRTVWGPRRVYGLRDCLLFFFRAVLFVLVVF